jgi:hypothetical protein
MTELVPGRCAVVTGPSVDSFEHINPAQLVAYRRLTSHAVDQTVRVFLADFEIMSVARGLKPLAAMFKSDRPASRKVTNAMLKTAAILMQLSQNKAEYRLYLVPQKTACLPTQTN